LRTIPKIFKHLVVLFVTLIFLFATVEIGFRVYYHKTGQIIAVDEEERCLKTAYKKASNESDPYRFEPYYPPHGVGELEYSNISGLTITNNVKGNTNWTGEVKSGIEFNIFEYFINTNSQHMRAIKDFDYEKNPERTRIVLLGDSYTWGDDVPNKYSYASILEQLIPNSEVLNFGIKGIGIDLMYLRWKYEALNFKPDIVVMTVYTDDIRRAQPCVHKPKFEINNNKLVITNIPPPSYKEIFENYKKPVFESYFLKHLLYNIKYFRGVTKKQYDYGFSILPFIIDEIKTKSKEDGTFFMVAIINGEGGVYKGYEEEAVKRFKSLLEEKKIPYVESFGIFNSEGYKENDKILYSGHFSVLGNALFAQGIKNKFEEQKVIYKQEDYYFDYNEKKVSIEERKKRYTLTGTALRLKNKINPTSVKYIQSSEMTFLNKSKTTELSDDLRWMLDPAAFFKSV